MVAVAMATARPSLGKKLTMTGHAPTMWGFVRTFALTVCLAVLTVSLTSMRVQRGRSTTGNEVTQLNGVTITIAKGNLASEAQTDDGIVGMVITGVSEAGGYTLNTPILVTSMIDVGNAGITVANNPYAIRQLTDFYNQAPAGAQCYVMLTANTVTQASMADKTNANGAIALLNFALAGGTGIKNLGLIPDDAAIHTAGGTITVTNGINASVQTAATNLLALINTFVAQQCPLRGFVSCTSYSGTASALAAINVGTSNNRVGFVIGDTQSYNSSYCSAAMGAFLGTVASVPVEQKVSWVGAGALANTAAFLNTVALTLTNNDPATIAGKGYITFKMYSGKVGFYWSGDPMATVPTDDFYYLVRGRVIDKAQALVYAYVINNQDGTVPALPNGTIDPGWAKDQENQISGSKGVLTVNMEDLGNCVSSATFIDTTQNIVSTSTVNMNITVYGEGYQITTNINLGL